METNLTEQNNPPNPPAPATFSGICPVCHQPVLPTDYFCPNCGTKLNTGPLPTTIMTQIGIYLFSIILPMILFIYVTKWPGLKYFKSNDPKAKRIGIAAWVILIISTVTVIWLAWFETVQLQKSVQSALDNATSGLNNITF